ncbi:radical SAM-associated putative lipoprotein [Ancylomarina longa]|uniref:Uncharacterized protein n=1 Tax=Ancylomarina longa TaxID=2487017 RepID=A0A434AVE1_9BACT|nr:radical SAM-associated putative lipoprotein [Ancylomarina longa]RUT78455.1 hypothetical protein DLK05_07710 [Ancylomarina longa]
MKIKFYKSYNKLLSIFLSLIGMGASLSLTSCDLSNNTRVEYGTPHATFKVHGVVSSETNVKIPNIRVVMREDTTFTDANGAYEVEISDFPGNQNFAMGFKDVDGSENGAYQPKDTTASFVNPQYIDGDSWYEGETSTEVNVNLKAEQK